MYLIRLDDACSYMDTGKWQKVEDILDAYRISPLVGIIPDCKDPVFVAEYAEDAGFWEKAVRWQKKGWIIGLHGHTHKYETNEAGINPVHNRSEFAGLPLDRQKEKIRAGYTILQEHGLEPNVFFAPSHTFDRNTLEALKTETSIRIISDTVANNVYKQYGMYFLPQQSGKCRNLPFAFTTIALHPNTMEAGDFELVESFLSRHHASCVKGFDDIPLLNRNYSVYDAFLSWLYFSKRNVKRFLKGSRNA